MAGDRIRVVSDDDNVGTLIEKGHPGETLQVTVGSETTNVTLTEEIPYGHKVALRNLEEGSQIVKYGEAIGTATEHIDRGDWVHVHNVASEYGRGDRDASDRVGSA
jgi:altronate dehydratase small subunit